MDQNKFVWCIASKLRSTYSAHVYNALGSGTLHTYVWCLLHDNLKSSWWRAVLTRGCVVVNILALPFIPGQRPQFSASCFVKVFSIRHRWWHHPHCHSSRYISSRTLHIRNGRTKWIKSISLKNLRRFNSSGWKLCRPFSCLDMKFKQCIAWLTMSISRSSRRLEHKNSDSRAMQMLNITCQDQVVEEMSHESAFIAQAIGQESKWLTLRAQHHCRISIRINLV